MRLLPLFFVLALSACAPPAVRTQALMPAKSMEASRLRQVAVLPFDGLGGREIAAEVEGAVAGITIDERQYFSVIDRVTLDKVLAEHKLQLSGAIDPATATQIGKLVGAKGIYTGNITVAKSEDHPYEEKRTGCAQYDQKGKCIEPRTYTVPCTKRTAAFSFTPKLIDVETGKVVYANNITGYATASACKADIGYEKPLPSGSDLIGTAKDSAMETFRKDIAPSYVTFNIKLMDSTEGIKSKGGQKKFEAGLEYAKAQRFDRACELWEEAREFSPDSPSILYNLGVCVEIKGELEQALELYKKADRQLSKPDYRITEALARIKKAMEDRQKLKERE